MTTVTASSTGYTPVKYTIQPLFGQKNTSWLDYDIRKVYPSFQHSEDIVYLLHSADLLSSLMRLNISNGRVDKLLENIICIAQPSINNIHHDIFYVVESRNDKQCVLSKFNVTSNLIERIAGDSCDFTSQGFNSFSELKFATNCLLAVHMSSPNENVHIYYSIFGKEKVYMIDERQRTTQVITLQSDISSLHVNSNDELFLVGYNSIGKLLSNGNTTTLYQSRSDLSFIQGFELDLTPQNNNIEIFYHAQYPDNQLFKTTITIDSQGNNKVNSEVISGVYATVGSRGDSGLAIDAQLSYYISMSLIRGKFWLIGYSIIRQIDLKTGIISSLLTSYGMRVFNTNELEAPFLLRSPRDVIYSYNQGNPSLLISESGSSSILRYSLASGKVENIENDLIPLSPNELYKATPVISNPYSIALDRDSNLLVSNDISHWSSNFLVKFNNSNMNSHSILFGNKLSSLNDIKTNVKASVLNRPSGVTSLQQKGDMLIFISDTNNNRVLMISTVNGTISTIASKEKHGIDGPYGITTVVDIDNRDIYILFSDSNNHCVRAINLQDFSVSVFAGQPGTVGSINDHALNSTFNRPTGLSFGDGHVYVADSGNHMIRSISITTKSVKTFAGTGIPGFNGDGKLLLETQLNSPMDVVFTVTMGILVADTFNHRIRLLIPNFIVKTIAGSSVDGSGGDEGPAINSELFYPHSISFGVTAIYIAGRFCL